MSSLREKVNQLDRNVEDINVSLDRIDRALCKLSFRMDKAGLKERNNGSDLDIEKSFSAQYGEILSSLDTVREYMKILVKSRRDGLLSTPSFIESVHDAIHRYDNNVERLNFLVGNHDHYLHKPFDGLREFIHIYESTR